MIPEFKLKLENLNLTFLFVPATFGWGLLIVALISAVFYFVIYLKYHIKGNISQVPREEPPQNISPAAARFIYEGDFDSDCLLAGVLNATIKNCYRINWREDSFSIALANHSLTSTLHKDEKAALSYNPAFFLKQLGISKNKTKFTDKAEERMQKVLLKDYGKYFVKRGLFILIGAVLSALMILTLGFLYAPSDKTELMRYVLIYIPMAFSSIYILKMSIDNQNWGLFPASLVFFGFAVMGIIQMENQADMLLSATVLPFAILHTSAWFVLPKYTREGFQLYIELKEFKHFLQTRMQTNPVLSEDEAYLLPYLIAFNIDFNNSSYFEPLLTTYKTTASPFFYQFTRFGK